MSLLQKKYLSTGENGVRRGYTLIEIVISVGLIALLLVVIIETAITVSRSREQAQGFLEMNAAAMGAFSRFSRDIRRATAVDIINSVFNASSGKIVLKMKREDGADDTTVFYLAGNRVRETYNGADRGDITPPTTDVSNLTFRLFSVASTTAVRVEMTVSPSASSTVPAVNFYGTYVLRGSYVE